MQDVVARSATGEPIEIDMPEVRAEIGEERLKEWRQMIHSVARPDKSPIDEFQVEMPLGTLSIQLQEADNRGGGYMQATLKKEGEIRWVSDPFHRIGDGAPSVIGQDGSRVALTIVEE